MCKTIGIGNICMRMFDGQIRTLTNIRHFLNLKKNFLLLGPFEAQGYNFSSTDGGIKVTEGSITILKGERTTNGGEYTSKEFKDYLASKGIKYQLSISGRSEQNRVAERMNRTLTECACSIKLQVNMSEGF